MFVLLLTLLAAVEATPVPQQVISQNGALLVPVSRLAQTQIQGVPYVILSQGQAATGQQVPAGRFFLRSFSTAPTFRTQTLIPIEQAPATVSTLIGPAQVQPAQVTRIATATRLDDVDDDQASTEEVETERTRAVLVRQELVRPGQKLAVFRKPLGGNIDNVQVAKEVPQELRPYSFSYEINGPDTGDVKSASETSDGKVIKGSYSLIEPDGTLRRVIYQADAINGFTAQVERTAGAYPPIPDPVRRPDAEFTLRDNQPPQQ
jgi:hypothetical protein